jgi:hypothetical protein
VRAVPCAAHTPVPTSEEGIVSGRRPCTPCPAPRARGRVVVRTAWGIYAAGHVERRAERRGGGDWGARPGHGPRQGGKRFCSVPVRARGKGEQWERAKGPTGGFRSVRAGPSGRTPARPHAPAIASNSSKHGCGAAAVADGRCCLGRSDRGGIHCGSRGCRAAVPSRGSAAARAYCCWY